ncbi:MAG: choice-of-anchor Q domain-containing protein, partial [Chloroflexota bacterium]
MKKIFLSAILALVLLASGLGARPARAAVTWTVNSLNDPGNGYCDLVECTLREAIAVAGPTDTINFNVTGAIYLDSQLVIGIPLNIVGPGASNLIVSGAFVTRVFSVNSPNVPVNISGITIADGYITGAPVNDGAGIYNLGILNLDKVLLDYNTSSGTSGGGAIYNGSKATLTITNSAFTENFSPTRGGAIANYGSANVSNSAFYGNIADNGSGGGIFNLGYLTVNNSTFSENASTTNGSGIYNGIATLTLKNSIIANGTGVDCYNAATIKPPVVAGNLIETNAAGQNACGTPAVTGDPMLASLDYYGGSTPTLGLLAGSPALDSAHDLSCAAFDQRGVSRPQGPHCDIGAFEALAPPTVTVEQAAGQPDPTNVSPIHFTVTFSQEVTGFANNDVVLGGSAGATTAVVNGTGTTYDVVVSGMTGNGTVIASVNADAAFNADGLGNLASTSVDNIVTYEVLTYPSVQSSVR